MITDRETAIRALQAGDSAEALRVLTCKHTGKEETREQERRDQPKDDIFDLTLGASHYHFHCDLCGCAYYRAF